MAWQEKDVIVESLRFKNMGNHFRLIKAKSCCLKGRRKGKLHDLHRDCVVWWRNATNLWKTGRE